MYPPAVVMPLFGEQQRRRVSPVDVALALLLPIMTCVFGSWIYFVIAGARRRDPRQYVVAAAYFVAFIAFSVVAFVVDPSPVESDYLTTAEVVGLLSLVLLAIVAAVHGLVLAIHTSHDEHLRDVREHARQFARFSPDQARRIGIGRPDLARGYDDGGLIDLNHVNDDELARATGLTLDEAHRIVSDRLTRGPFRYPEDLVMRQLATKRTVRKLAPRLICIAPM
jgi:DNA uptake protein ComE-like DNA-binding protein